MTKKELTKLVAEKADITGIAAGKAIQTVLDAIQSELQHGRRIEFRGFGVFDVKDRKARTARNPKTGEKVEVPAKRVVTFAPSADLLGDLPVEQAADAA